MKDIAKVLRVRKMKYRKISLGMTALVACLLIGIALGEDYMEGGYVQSFDRSKMMDPGIAGMVQWLDAPVPSFPWYSSGISFYRQTVPSSIFTPYREYYATEASPTLNGIVSSPAKFNVTEQPPYGIYYGNGQGQTYTQYASSTPTNTNDLWILGATNWTQYAVSPVGASLQLVAGVQAGGMGGIYEVVQTDRVSTEYRTYQFNPGYSTMNFRADRMGRHMLYFVVNNQPSNVVIVDVFSQLHGK